METPEEAAERCLGELGSKMKNSQVVEIMPACSIDVHPQVVRAIHDRLQEAASGSNLCGSDTFHAAMVPPDRREAMPNKPRRRFGYA